MEAAPKMVLADLASLNHDNLAPHKTLNARVYTHYVHRIKSKLKSILFELQNEIYRKMTKNKFLGKKSKQFIFLGNNYSGYWFPKSFLLKKGTIWGVGLGHDSSFELELVKEGYAFFGFEPQRDCYNISKNQFIGTTAVIENYGLWDKSGSFRYTGANISIVNIFNLEEISNEELEIRSLWEVATEKKLDQNKSPKILKLNIEGAEKEILLKLVRDPLEFEMIIFQAEFLFHIGFKRFREKWKSYKELQNILVGFQKIGWVVEDVSRHQITLIKD